MIRDLMISVNIDRSVSPKEIKIANQFEIKTNRIDFRLTFPYEGNVYLILTNQDGSFYLPLQNNHFIFDSSETWIQGGWNAHIFISDTEIVDGVVDKTKALFISDDFGLWVEPSDINIDDLQSQPLPKQLKLIYDELLVLKDELEKATVQGKYFDVIYIRDKSTGVIYGLEINLGEMTIEESNSSEFVDDLKLYDKKMQKYFSITVSNGELYMEDIDEN